MTIGLTPEQQHLTDAVAQFASRHAPVSHTRELLDQLAGGELPPWWNELVANGFHAVHLPESCGGQGGTLADTACVVEAAAGAALPGPLLPTVAAGAVALHADRNPAATDLLTALADGAPGAVVLPEYSDLRATPADGGWRVSGATTAIPGACSARILLLPAHTGDAQVIWLAVAADAPGVTAEPVGGTDITTDAGVVRLDGHDAPASAVLTGIDGDRARCVVVALTACASAGIAGWCVGAVTAHLRTREQFGRPIGSFQALQHRAAMLLVNAELAAAAAWDAVRADGDSAEQHRIAAAGAAVTAVAAAPDLVLDALTMFGAIGFTWEHDLHLYWRRATSLAGAVGPTSRWTRRMGELATTAVRDMAVNLGAAEADLRATVAETLERALTLRNDGIGRQGDYEHFMTGPQRTLLADAGLIAPHWPAPWGLDATPLQQLVIDEEFARRPNLVRPSLGIAEWIVPSLLQAAPPEVQHRLIPPTQRGELGWCQLFSEPGAGSDLASLSTRATRVEGGWRINGHKIWTSSADRADYGALLARTDPDAAKHRGIGYFVLDMRTPGVEVQPIKQANGEAHFNEVFLSDVFVPDEMLLGDPAAGWQLAITTMATERVAISGYVNNDRATSLRAMASGPDGEDVRRALGEIDAYTNAIRALGVRETLRLLDGQAAGPASSIAKVATTVLLRKVSRHTLELAGPLAVTEQSDPPVVTPYLHLPAELIGGGTPEIQLNIIAQMILGLPRK